MSPGMTGWATIALMSRWQRISAQPKIAADRFLFLYFQAVTSPSFFLDQYILLFHQYIAALLSPKMPEKWCQELREVYRHAVVSIYFLSYLMYGISSRQHNELLDDSIVWLRDYSLLINAIIITSIAMPFMAIPINAPKISVRFNCLISKIAMIPSKRPERGSPAINGNNIHIIFADGLIPARPSIIPIRIGTTYVKMARIQLAFAAAAFRTITHQYFLVQQ